MVPFEINNIEPLAYANMWKASIILFLPQLIQDVEVGQTANITVRFEASDDASMVELVGAAASKAGEALAGYVQILEGRDGRELLKSYRETTAQSYSFDPLPDDLDGE